MAQDQTELRRIDWQSTFAFTRLFSGFRSALHSTKVLLALAGLILTLLLGGFLDFLWVHAGQGVWSGEIAVYAASGGQRDYARSLSKVRYDRLAEILLQNRVATNQTEAQQQASNNPGPATEQAEERILEQYRKSRDAAGTPEARASLFRNMQAQVKELDALKPVGPFREYASFQMGAIRSAIFSAAQLRLTDGLDTVLRGEAVSQPGVLAALVMMWYGLVWLLKVHYVYALFFGLPALAVWAVAGGAISRAAIVQFAKEERIGLREAVRFSIAKFWGFFFAPLVSFAFVLAFGLLLIVGGLVGAIPVVGDILVGVLWFLALVAGLAIAFISIGLLAGGHLFFPVVAAEGSDAFDAISRGFVYVYSRPWKSMLYGLTLLVYGSVCYLFLRVFVWLMLVATHAFVSAGMMVSRPEAGPGLRNFDVIWDQPSFLNLQPAPLNYELLGFGDMILMFFVCLWTYLVWGALQSWLISFYFTGSSMAYLLLRKDVDAIGVDEIYTEEEPEPETLAEAAAPAAAPASSNPSPASPPAGEPGGPSVAQ